MSKKYNRTFHLPYSQGATNDDKIALSVNTLLNNEIIITEKCDGSNASLEAAGCFARTHSGPPTHKSFDWLKSFHSTIKHKIPNNIQLFGENMWAVHSIQYSELPGYFLLFNVREDDTWLSWDDVELWAQIIEVPTVPVLFKGIVKNEDQLKKLVENLMIEKSKCGGIREGVVVRISKSFSDEDFPYSIFKMVRANHVNTDEHWMHKEIIKNKLKV